jgi:sulfoxide reductase heme-binding subunit YedZ
MTVAALSTQALWYSSRGTGLVAVILFSLVVVLGILQVHGIEGPGRQRFIITQVHRNASLVAVAFIAVHIISSIADGFAPISWIDAFIPFLSPYRPLWLGLGAVAVDLIIAIVVTSLLRTRLSLNAWRIVHWFSYVCWPIVILHSLGTGTDGRSGVVQLTYLVCVIAVVIACAWRVMRNWSHQPIARAFSAGAGIITIIVITIWALTGPTQVGWAKKAGTPASLLGTGTSGDTTLGFNPPFTTDFSGTITQSGSKTSGGTATLTANGSFTSSAAGTFTMAINGTNSSSGGLQFKTGTMTMGPPENPTQYSGPISTAAGSTITAKVSDNAGHTYTATMEITDNPSGGSGVLGTMTVTP